MKAILSSDTDKFRFFYKVDAHQQDDEKCKDYQHQFLKINSLRFWKSFSDDPVKYLMVGGFAVAIHGYTRATEDIDTWIKDDIENLRNLGVAMKVFGYGELSRERYSLCPVG